MPRSWQRLGGPGSPGESLGLGLTVLPRPEQRSVRGLELLGGAGDLRDLEGLLAPAHLSRQALLAKEEAEWHY